VPFTRDPLSARYDRAAASLIGRAIGRAGQRRVALRWAVGIIESPGGEYREPGGQRLTRTERAFVRALYYDPRVYHRSPDKAYSLKEPVWMAPVGRTREVRIRIFPDTAGARYAEGRPVGYVKIPALRSRTAVIRQS
jgi:hypothetical protein